MQPPRRVDERWRLAALGVAVALLTSCRAPPVLLRLGDKGRWVLWNPFRDKALEAWTAARLRSLHASCRSRVAEDDPVCPTILRLSEADLGALSLVDRDDTGGEAQLHYSLGGASFSYPVVGLFVTVREGRGKVREIEGLKLIR